MADETMPQVRLPVERRAARNRAALAGEMTYFDPRPCRFGHVCPRYTKSARCMICKKVKAAASAKANRGKLRASKQRWYDANKDAINAARTVEQRAADAARSRQRRKDHPEAVRKSDRVWYASNTEAVKAKSRNRKARVKAAVGHHTAADIRALLSLQKARCVYCLASIAKKYHVDHRHPIAKGGGNDPANLQLLCAPCNLSKSDKHPIAFAQERGLLL